MNETIRHKLSQLPERPGVYIMRDAGRAVLYVGKAKVLRNRVRSYFGDIRDLHPRTQAMVSLVVDFDTIVVGTEREALTLEATLIKRYKPKYNVRLVDDKSYPYIKISTPLRFPKISVVRGAAQLQEDGARYFGPYTNAGAMWEVVRLIRRVFKIRQETKNSVNRRAGCPWDEQGAPLKRPCLDYGIMLCTGPCAGMVSEEEYRAQVQQTVLFLEGRMEHLIAELTEEMARAAGDLRFETAARVRDKLLKIQQIHQDARTVSAKREDFDVIGFHVRADEAVFTVSMVREGKLIDQQHHLLNGVTQAEEDELLVAFLTQKYARVGSPPRAILLPMPVSEAALLADWLSSRRGRRVRFLVPRRGLKADMVRITMDNARIYLEQRQARRSEESTKAAEALAELGAVLGLPEPPARMECYDISTFQGSDSVGSMVVFADGLPDKAQYRRFKIHYNTGAPDDYAMMREMLERRLGAALMKSRKFSMLPDLMIIDGGKGQLGVAVKAMRDLGIAVPVIGLAKRFEEVFVPDREAPLYVPRHSRALHLLQTIRDEAHRFALQYHTTLRNRRVKESLLDEIPGIGKTRKLTLLKHFGSVEKLRKATPEEIAQVPGFSRAAGEKLLAALESAAASG
jgi:excinuclease ABC subunit C